MTRNCDVFCLQLFSSLRMGTTLTLVDNIKLNVLPQGVSMGSINNTMHRKNLCRHKAVASSPAGPILAR